MVLTDIFMFFGRLHPVVVHLPIGFLLLAITFDLVSYRKRFKPLETAVPFTLLLGAITSAIACGLGLMLSSTGDYDPVILSHHRLAGIFLMLLAGVLYLIKISPTKFIARKAYSAASIILLITILYGGHQGAILTHGKDYITIESLFHQPRKKPAQVSEALVFEDIVHPILGKRCMSCHNADKRKGRLSMVTLSSLIKGGKHGPSIVPGNALESELYIRITLDPAHEDFMPKDGKPPPTEAEIKIIRWWIDEAHATDEKKVSAIKDYDRMEPLLTSVLGLAPPSGASITTTAYDPKVNEKIPDTLDMSLVDNLRSKGAIVRLMSHNPAMLDVTLPPHSGKRIEEISSELQAVANNIIWLNLSDNGFKESDLEILQQLLNMEKLRLEKNPISDEVSNHLRNLKFLNSVNLNETLVGIKCVTSLRSNPSIKRIYTWKTKCDSIAYYNN